MPLPHWRSGWRALANGRRADAAAARPVSDPVQEHEAGRGHRHAALGLLSVSGALVRIDNFSVSLREASGDYRAFSRVPGVAVEVRDPLAVHHELLDQYTDEAIHDVVAYLWTLK